MTFRLGLTCIFYLFPIWLSAQLHYSNSEASFLVAEKAGEYQVECTLKRDVKGSRHLKRVQNRLRLRAVDLVGSYIVFKNLDFDYPDKDQLFGAFIDYTNLSFQAQVDDFSHGQWDFCDGARCITFNCSTTDFIIGEQQMPEEIDFTRILMYDFRKNKTLYGACNIVSAGLTGPDEMLDLEMVFLSGNAQIDASTSKLQNLNPGSRLENSLFDYDSLMQREVNSALENAGVSCPFGEMIRAKILFTSADVSVKDSIFETYLENLANCDNQWCQVQLFATENRDMSGFFGFEEATVFEVIGAYPGALDVFGMRIGYAGEKYSAALEAFSHEDFETALEKLRDEINFSGISPEALNLTGACYRVQEQPEKALPFLLLSCYLNRETTYLAGNLCLCLDALNYSGIEQLAAYYLNAPNIDKWSKNQISNLINQ